MPQPRPGVTKQINECVFFLIKRFPTVIKLWNHASVRTTHSQAAGLVVNSVGYPAAKGGLAGGVEPLKGGWGHAELHLSGTLRKEQAAQAKGHQGWSPSSGHSGFSPPHPISFQTSPKGSLSPPRGSGAAQCYAEAGEEVGTGLALVSCPWRYAGATLTHIKLFQLTRLTVMFWGLSRAGLSEAVSDAQLVNNLPAVQETTCNERVLGSTLSWEDALEEEMATHSSILAWKIPWTEEPGELRSIGSQRMGHDIATRQ